MGINGIYRDRRRAYILKGFEWQVLPCENHITELQVAKGELSKDLDVAKEATKRVAEDAQARKSHAKRPPKVWGIEFPWPRNPRKSLPRTCLTPIFERNYMKLACQMASKYEI